MNDTTTTPARVPLTDLETRRRAAATVAKAYTGTLQWWVSLVVFAGLAGLLVKMASQAHRDNFGASWTVSLAIGALVCVVIGLGYVPLVMAVVIYRSRDLYYLDTGKARAAMATKPDNRRRQLPDDVQGHSLGAWPRKQGAGDLLGPWVREQVHAQGGRLTATALPGTARAYKQRGMVDDGHTAFVLPRVASKPRPNGDTTTAADATQATDPDQAGGPTS